eukprot:6212710-Pleurochrysis_carterae.AAC.8
MPLRFRQTDTANEFRRLCSFDSPELKLNIPQSFSGRTSKFRGMRPCQVFTCMFPDLMPSSFEGFITG